MDTGYFFYDEKNKKTEQIDKDDYRTIHDWNYSRAQSKEDKDLASRDYFHGIRAKTNAILPQKLEMESWAGKSYKNKLTTEQRVQSLNNPRSEIYQKNENAEKIVDAQTGIPVQVDKICTTMARKHHVSKNALKPIALFYGSSKTRNTNLTNAWLNRSTNPLAMLTEVFRSFVNISFNGLDLSTDKKIAKNAAFMETLCLQYDSIVDILTDYREDYNKLDSKVKDIVEKKIGEAGGLVNYYRLMKVVLTNPYYVSHENRELSLNTNPNDSAEKKRLMNQLWLAKGGLTALTDYGAKKLDDNLRKLCGELQTNIVTDEQLKIQDKLIERDEDIEKNGFSNHLESAEKNQQNIHLSKKNEKTLFTRARKGITALDLPEKVEDAAGSVTLILDQLQFVEALTADKIDHKNFYYLEQNYKDIAVVEQVTTLSAPLIELKKAILSIYNISSKGYMKVSRISSAKRKEAQLRYESALSAYRSGMNMVVHLRKGKMLPQDATSMKALIKDSEAARRGKIKQKANVTAKEKEAVREKIKDLMMTLSNNRFSEYSIYENAKKIMELNVERQAVLGNEGNYHNFRRIAYLAEYFWIRRRRADINYALTKQELTEKEIIALSAEDRELAPYIEKDKKPLDVVENSLEELQKMRREADLDSRGLADLKATASHYLFQEEWSKNSNRVKDGWAKRFSRSFYSGITRFLGWIFSAPKTTNHGKGRFAESKEKMNLLPAEIKALGDQNANPSVTHGDGTVAPAVELNKYYKDSMKMTIAGDYAAISALMVDNADYPDYLKDALDALSQYTQVRGIVNRDTFEMEHAFLDTFRSGVEEMIKDPETRSRYPELCNRMLTAYTNVMILGNGNLAEHMTKADLSAVKEAKSIYANDTYTGDMKESNMQFLPLFPHEPNLNDIKQGTTGDCYLMAAVQKVVYDNPNAIRDMFHDLGDGNVVVRLYAPFGVITDSNGIKAYRRIDDPNKMNDYTMRPVYIKVRKQYTTGDAQNTDSMWVQLLEKAYAAAGFNAGISEVAEDGELLNMNKELTDGSSRTALAHLTGQKYATTVTSKMAKMTIEQSEIERHQTSANIQQALLCKGIDGFLARLIYNKLIHAKKAACKAGVLADNYEEDMITNAIRDSLSTYSPDKEMDKFAANLKALKDAKRISEDEAAALELIIKQRHDKSEARVKRLTNRILTNIKNPDKKISKNPEMYLSLGEINMRIKNILKTEGPAYDSVSKIVNSKSKTFKQLPSNDEAQNSAYQYSVKNFMVLNPDNRYNQDELAILRLVKKETLAGRAVPIENDGHCMTALDVKLHNGKWFILIRDPFNVFRTEYQTVNGQIQKSEYGLGSTLTQHFKIRNLTPDMKQGFLGTCWWELKDAVKNIKMMHNVVED